MSLAVKLIKCCTRPRVTYSEELDYSHSNLLDLPSDVLSKAKTLVALSLSSNAIRNLPFVSSHSSLYKRANISKIIVLS